jgi:hypothetical protein
MLGYELKNEGCAKLQTGGRKLWRDISVDGYREISRINLIEPAKKTPRQPTDHFKVFFSYGHCYAASIS